ncbi:MAG: glycosyltransferase [Actinobacteria bacterium]|nr:glycosyltransferase [Actinomycetota bacterium]
MIKKKKRVLIISFYFPPENNIGAIRLGKFAKYLPDYGWEPIIITSSKASISGSISNHTLPIEVNISNIIELPYFSIAPHIYDSLSAKKNIDSDNNSFSLLNLKCKGLIYKIIKLAEPIYSLAIFQPLIQDPIGWYFYAVKECHKIISNGIDLIFSSYGPSTSHLIASKLQKETELPWVADFRDLWSMNPYVKSIFPLNLFERSIEKNILKNSTLLITVSEGLGKYLSGLHHKRVEIIPNGFDEEDGP